MEKECKKLVVHFQIDSEQALRDVFARYHGELGYPKILVSQVSFPDYLLEDASGNRIKAEAELRSSGYDHPFEGCDLVICWEADQKLPIRTLELCRYIELPYVFNGFQEEELHNLSEHVRKYEIVANKSKNLLKDLAGVVKRRDHCSICSNVRILSESYDEEMVAKDELIVAKTYALQCRRDRWQLFPVQVAINFEREELLVEGRLYSYYLESKILNQEKWKELLQKAGKQDFTYISRAFLHSAPQESSIDTLSQSFPDLKKIWYIAFAKKHNIDFLYQERDSILDSLSATIISLLDLLDFANLYGQQNSTA